MPQSKSKPFFNFHFHTHVISKEFGCRNSSNKRWLMVIMLNLKSFFFFGGGSSFWSHRAQTYLRDIPRVSCRRFYSIFFEHLYIWDECICWVYSNMHSRDFPNTVPEPRIASEQHAGKILICFHIFCDILRQPFWKSYFPRKLRQHRE